MSKSKETVRIYGLVLKTKEKDLSKPKGLVENMLEIGRDFDSAKSGETIRIVTGEGVEYNHPYVGLKAREAKKRGVNFEVIVGPVLQSKIHIPGLSDAYLKEWYPTDKKDVSEYEKIGDSLFVTMELEPSLYAHQKALEETPNERIQSKIASLQTTIQQIKQMSKK